MQCEERIKIQDDILSESIAYGMLCEERIKQIFPKQTFPVTQKQIDEFKGLEDTKDSKDSSESK